MIDRFALQASGRAVWVLALVAGVAAVAFILGSVMTARSAPSASPVHACASRYTGQLRYATGPERCTAAEFPVSWNSFDGPLTPDDLSAELLDYIDQQVSLNLTVHSDETVYAGPLAPGAILSHTQNCPGGGQVISGGVSVQPDSASTLVESYRSATSAWTATVRIDAPLGPFTLGIHMLCATP